MKRPWPPIRTRRPCPGLGLQSAAAAAPPAPVLDHRPPKACACVAVTNPGSRLAPPRPLQQAHVIVNNALKLYSQDKTGMVDFALESGGRWRPLTPVGAPPSGAGGSQGLSETRGRSLVCWLQEVVRSPPWRGGGCAHGHPSVVQVGPCVGVSRDTPVWGESVALVISGS